MKFHFFFSVVIILILPSCATILNKKVQTVEILPDKNTEVLSVIQDSTTIQSNSQYYLVSRNSKPLDIKYKNKLDSQTRSTSTKPFLSNSFWWNIYFNYGLGIIVDMKSDKKYAFPKRMYITSDNLIVKEKKGNIKLFIPLEYIDIYKKQNNTTYKFFTMPLFNLPLGLEYYYKHNQFISAEMNLGLYWESTTRSDSSTRLNYLGDLALLFSLRNNYVKNNFELSYGLSALNSTRFNSLGASLGATNMFSNITGIQLLYEPNLLDMRSFNLNYGHTFRLRFLIKMAVKK